MAFRAYTVAEVREAAEAYGVDPDFAEAIYAIESSRGTNPQALTTRKVNRKKGGPTFVRGPFQLEDETTNDILSKHGLKGVNVEDPDMHLDLAMRHMRDLQDRRNGDFSKMFQDYLGRGTDELGTTSQSYADKGMAEMQKLKGGAPATTASDLYASAPTGGTYGMMPADDLFGIPEMPAPDTRPTMPTGMEASLSKLAQVPRDPLGLPMNITAATTPHPLQAPKTDYDEYIRKLVDEELQGRDYATG